MSTSCKYLLLVNPFWVRLVIQSVVVINLLLIALDKTLYRFDKREIRCQFLIFVTSPFLGINQIVADLKVSVSLPFRKQQLA